jgi:uncharacterized sulfatase
LIVYFPENWKHLAPPEYRAGGVSNRLVSFVDFAPTMLSLAGEPAPKWMQGRAFAGKHIQPAPEFLHGFRGRMDERIDLQRSVTDGRYVYLRNYMPHLPAGQHLEYQMQTKTTAVWKKMFDISKLDYAQSQFWRSPRVPSELYDLKNDPHEVKNLCISYDIEFKTVLDIVVRMNTALEKHIMSIRDVGLLPEDELHSRSKGGPPYTMARDDDRYPLDPIMAMADHASSVVPVTHFNVEVKKGILRKRLEHEESAVRYWAAMGIIRFGEPIVSQYADLLRQTAHHDESASVRVVTAEALALYGPKDDVGEAIRVLVKHAAPKGNAIYIRLAALNALDRLGEKARPGLATIKSWPTDVPKDDRAAYGIPRLINKIVKQLEN